MGTIQYQPPECMTETQFSTFPVDIWSLGVTIYNYYYR